MPLIRKDRDQPAPAPTAAPDLATALASGEPDARWAAARALAGSVENAELLGRALQSETDPRVREAIFTSLARIGTAASVEAVAPWLRSDEAELRTAALDALRAMPHAAGERLPALLGDPDPDVRLLACEIARALPGPAAGVLLCTLLETEPEPNVCAAAIEVLAEIGGPDALPALARCKGRFADQPFLAFSVAVAAERIGVGGGRLRG